MRGATTAAIGALLPALPAAAPAQIGTGAPPGAGVGTMTVPPGAGVGTMTVPPGPSGGSNGSAMGSRGPTTPITRIATACAGTSAAIGPDGPRNPEMFLGMG
jgi:hypothetical protein